jgi:hypothetical protein
MGPILIYTLKFVMNIKKADGLSIVILGKKPANAVGGIL